MRTLFENELEIKKAFFTTWDDAARSTVQSIFSFSEQCGNNSLADVTRDVSIYLYNIIDGIPFNNLNDDFYSYHISHLKNLINFYIDMDMQEIDPANIDRENNRDHYLESIKIHQGLFLLASHCSISIFNNLLNDEEYSSFANVELNPSMIATTVIKKQNDYGPENVAKFGMWGLIVRLHDKIARFENLMSKNRSGKNAVSDETIYDTLLDIIGYSTVAILWSYGWFFLPLNKDL